MEKSEAIIAVLLVIAIVASIASMVVMNNKVSAVTGKATGTGLVNASVNSMVAFTLNPAIVDFGSVDAGNQSNTETLGNAPAPFTVKNDGTQLLNMSLKYTGELFTGVTGKEFKWKATTSNAVGSVSTYTDALTTDNQLLTGLNYVDGSDTSDIDVQITVPKDEHAGYKYTTVTFTASP